MSAAASAWVLYLRQNQTHVLPRPHAPCAVRAWETHEGTCSAVLCSACP